VAVLGDPSRASVWTTWATSASRHSAALGRGDLGLAGLEAWADKEGGQGGSGSAEAHACPGYGSRPLHVLVAPKPRRPP
jgi:hypothetical protein